MSAFGQICTTLSDAETRLAIGQKGEKFSLETQNAFFKDGNVVGVDGPISVVKTVTK